MNRQRSKEESFGDYREALKNEERVLKNKLKGKLLYNSNQGQVVNLGKVGRGVVYKKPKEHIYISRQEVKRTLRGKQNEL